MLLKLRLGLVNKDHSVIVCFWAVYIVTVLEKGRVCVCVCVCVYSPDNVRCRCSSGPV